MVIFDALPLLTNATLLDGLTRLHYIHSIGIDIAWQKEQGSIYARIDVMALHDMI
jgi:hypothetical protein